jgi:BirA family biotin operon repressor/biotin-[acetyl-CoA-carboxylase] ligase
MQAMPAPATFRHIALAETGSTNAEALALARSGERGPLWITAARQTQGRGRRGNAWFSLAGNLHASLLLTAPCTPEKAPQLSFVAALALHDAVSVCAPQVAPMLALKWPNDLLLASAKVAGILIEGESDAVFAVVIGFGVNCAEHPEGMPYPATDLAAAGSKVAPAALLEALTAAMEQRLAQWSRGVGFAAIRADWLARAAGLGQEISVRLPEREFTGRFEGLDEEGGLLVMQPGGVSAVRAGEVFALGGR